MAEQNQPLTPIQLRALQYTLNTGSGATHAHFLEDHDPIGEQLWNELHNAGLVRQDQHARIYLTEIGMQVLGENGAQ